jgi:preprotein translocase subunit YajC
VITTSGLVGIVEETDDEYVTLEISDGVLVQVVKAAIGRIIPDEDATADEAVETADESTEPADAVVAEPVADKDPVDVPDAGRDKADGKVQDAPKLPPTHSEN